ncbi:MAG: Gldg family protein [Pirellulaceae bacterium]
MAVDFYISLGILAVFNLLFALAFMLVMIPLCMAKTASYAVMKRNFKSYFSNPTGYVFLAIFVLLTSMAAFWPHEFFNANLANLNQLNGQITLIMLLFIPAITMGLWADEKRLGTDELLLTLPATDFDIVIGKYIAAVSVFTVSLLFSQICNFLVLSALSQGSLDVGMFLTTYVGYWFIGLAMIALGMVASFLTNNLTLAFVLGIVINSPFVLLQYSDMFVTGAQSVSFFSEASMGRQFTDFGSGVISLSSLTYFLVMTLVGIYLSMVLIGRRHWLGGRDGESRLGHYLLRSACLLVIAISGTLIFVMHDVRWDFTANHTSSLLPETRQLLRELETEEPIRIEAFVSANVPESHAQTKLDLLNYLNEFRGLGGSRVLVTIHEGVDSFSETADIAREKYGIEPRQMVSQSRGSFKQEDVILGAAIQRGLDRVVIPFFDNGIPVEYELIRSIGTVTAQKKNRLGVLNTDAKLFGGVEQGMMGGFQQIPRQIILDELEKFYEVIEVDPSETIAPGDYDVLLAVQPSSLTPPQLENLITAIRSGIPTALCDDPMPVGLNQAPPISQNKRSPQQMMGQGAPPQAKGDIRQLWNLLGVQMVGEKLPTNPNFNALIVWQDYNPERRFEGLGNVTPEWVFIDRNLPGARAADQPLPINQEVALTKDLQQMLFLFPGGLVKQSDFPKSLNYTPLISTATQPQMIGTVSLDELTRAFSGPQMQQPRRQFAPLDQGRVEPYVLAALINGTLEEGGGDINVAMVGDIDLLHNDFVQLRAQNIDGVPLEIDNTNFLLNLLDHLAGEPRFIPIRSRSAPLARLSLMDEITKMSRQRSTQLIEDATARAKTVEEELQDELQAPIDELNKKLAQLQERGRTGQDISEQDIQEFQQRNLELNQRRTAVQKRMEVAREKLQAEFKQEQERITRDLNREVLYRQNQVKMLAVALPPIPPILIGIIVFVIRRLKEREGLSKDRIVK